MLNTHTHTHTHRKRYHFTNAAISKQSQHRHIVCPDSAPHHLWTKQTVEHIWPIRFDEKISDLRFQWDLEAEGVGTCLMSVPVAWPERGGLHTVSVLFRSLCTFLLVRAKSCWSVRLARPVCPQLILSRQAVSSKQHPSLQIYRYMFIFMLSSKKVWRSNVLSPSLF